MVDSYLADNQVSKVSAFIKRIKESAQRFRFCGVNSPHQNGVVERVVKTISDT